jgi:hypothetical protein
MPEYEIQRWDPVIPKGNIEPYPMVYIKPDPSFFDYIKENNYLFLVTISESDSVYDRQIMALADMSAFFPNYRPNFFNETGFYVLTLFSSWNGYPPKNGKILIQGLKGPDNVVPVEKTFKAPVPLEWYEPNDKKEKDKDSLSFRQIGFILLIIIIICILFYLFSSSSKNKSKNKSNKSNKSN